MERLTKADRACAVVAAAIGNDFNSELTVVLNGLALGIAKLEPGHPARQPFSEAQVATQRCASLCLEMLRYSARAGIRPVRGSVPAVLGV
jgi:hypothetical protein